jgi:hypothetical protein
MKCDSCSKKERIAREEKIKAEREELKRIADDPTVPVRKRLEARYRAKKI